MCFPGLAQPGAVSGRLARGTAAAAPGAGPGKGRPRTQWPAARSTLRRVPRGLSPHREELREKLESSLIGGLCLEAAGFALCRGGAGAVLLIVCRS